MLCRTMVFDLFGTLVPFPSAEHKRTLDEMSAILSVPFNVSWELWTRAYADQELGETIEESIRRVCREADINLVANQVEQAARVWWAFQRQLLSCASEPACKVVAERKKS
jgi:FMN phosphatase YigB (HAD superfamily)